MKDAIAIKRVEKACVFCGGAPESKNKEHVLPKWLIAMTGDPKRQVLLGINYFDPKPFKKFAFDQFTFPACEKCNSAYSNFEGEVKTVLQKILDKNNITENEIDLMLDWFDKVRIGLWLGSRFLSNNFNDVAPNFHILSRVGFADRLLFITNTESSDGLTASGAMTPMFSIYPSAFGLRVNGTLFMSVSTDHLVSKDLGFPYARKRWATETDAVSMEINKGKGNFSGVQFSRNYSIPALKIYQPIYRKILNSKYFMDDEYIKDNSLNPLYGKGRIFIESDKGLKRGGVVADDYLCSEYVLKQDVNTEFVCNVLRAQNELVKLIPSERMLPPYKRGRSKKFTSAYSYNINLINNLYSGNIINSDAKVDEANNRYQSETHPSIVSRMKQYLKNT